MAILLLLLGSVLGVSVMVFFNARLGISGKARLASLDDAVTRLDTDRVGFEAGEGVLATDGEAALVMDRTGDCLGVLIARGSDFVIRYLTPGSVREVTTEADNTVRLSLNDFVFAPARLRFESADTASHWAGKLDMFKTQGRS